MKKHIMKLMACPLIAVAACSSPESVALSYGRLPDLPDSPSLSKMSPSPLGVSAPFVGILGASLVVAGGCNFPDKPVADGGTKRYYDEIWAIDLSSENSDWRLVGHLPYAVAYGSSVTTPSGIVCVGGNDASGSFSRCFSLNWDKDASQVLVRELVSLPCTVDNSSIAYSGGRVFIAGGNMDGTPSNRVIASDISPEGEISFWSDLTVFPGPARVQPVLAAFHSDRGHTLCLSGGFQPGDSRTAPQLPHDVLVCRNGEWQEASELPVLPDGSPRSLTGGCAVAFGESRVLFFGGVNYGRFFAAVDRPRQIAEAEAAGDIEKADALRTEGREYLRHEPFWYRFNDELWSYDLADGSWTRLGASQSLARAGAGAVLNGDTLFVVCGESMPGVRSPQIGVVCINGQYY